LKNLELLQIFYKICSAFLVQVPCSGFSSTDLLYYHWNEIVIAQNFSIRTINCSRNMLQQSQHVHDFCLIFIYKLVSSAK